MGSIPSGISGSRAASVLGLSQYQTPVDVWLQIMEEIEPGYCRSHGYVEPEPVDNAAVRWGKAFEDAIIRIAESRQGEDEITDREKLFIHPNYEFLTCHVDGIYQDCNPGSPGVRLHEGKTTTKYTFDAKWGEPGTDRIPREYQIQVQLQMMLSDIEKCIVSVLVFPERQQTWEDMGRKVVDAGDDDINVSPSDWAFFLDEMGYFHQYEINSHPKLQELMLKRMINFWKKHVLKKEPPPASAYSDIKKLCPEPQGTIVASEEIERLSKEYKDINDEFSRVKKRKDEVKTHILEYMRKNAEQKIDDESTERWLLYSRNGKKLHSYNGKIFR